MLTNTVAQRIAIELGKVLPGIDAPACGYRAKIEHMPQVERERFFSVVENSATVADKPADSVVIRNLYQVSADLERFAGWLNDRRLLKESVTVRLIAREHNLRALQLLEERG